eukprot:460565_1
MGFSKKSAVFALEHERGNVSKAIEHLLKGSDCHFGCVYECQHLFRITNRLKDIENHFAIENDEHTVQLLDDYAHLLYKHATLDDFEKIRLRLGDCDISRCNVSKRHYLRNRNNDTHIEKPSSVQHQMLDKIHCYFMHSHDVGFVITAQQRHEMEQKCNDEKDDNHMLITMKRIIEKKRKSQKHFENITSLNKFNRLNISKNNNKCSYNQYRFGLSFYYWMCFKNCD